MSKYTVVMIIGSTNTPMTYPERNRAANKEWEAYRISEGLSDKVIKSRCVYVDHHLNAGGGQYSLAIVNRGHSERSRAVAQRYVTNCCVALGTTRPWDGNDGHNDGVWVKDGTVKHTKMPAFVPEPLFIDNKHHQKILTSQRGLELLGSVLANTIIEMYPNGALVILSPGHGQYPDRYSPGAIMRGPGTTASYYDEDLNEMVIEDLPGPILGEEHAYCLSILAECREILEAAG